MLRPFLFVRPGSHRQMNINLEKYTDGYFEGALN